MLPKITWGDQEFYDISGIVQSDALMGGTRPGTDGVAIHHTVGQTEFPDKNANGTNLDEMIEHIKAIDRYHVQQQYGGFGYNAIVFRDGTVCVIGQGAGKRAHVAFENWHLFGIAIAGDFSTREIPMGAVLGVGRLLAAIEKVYGTTKVDGHRNWVQPAHAAQWSSACPGDRGLQFIGQMVMVKVAIQNKVTEAVAAEVRRKITEVLAPTLVSGDLVALAGQIHWLTGGKVC